MARTLAAVLVTCALLWSAALFLAPLALGRGHTRLTAVAGLVYQAAGLVCHQKPERSFHLAAVQQPVCARCLGLYVSGAVAALAAWIAGRGGVRLRSSDRVRLLLAVAAMPTAATVSLEFFHIMYLPNATRAVCALPLGAAGGWVFVSALLLEDRPRQPPRPTGTLNLECPD